MKKNFTISIMVLTAIFCTTTISPITESGLPSESVTPKKQKRRTLRRLVGQFKELLNKYANRKKEGASPYELEQYELRMMKFRNMVKRMGLLTAWLTGVVAAVGLTYQSGDPNAMYTILLTLPLIAAEISFAFRKKVELLNHMLKKHGGPKLVARKINSGSGLVYRKMMKPSKYPQSLLYLLLSDANNKKIEGAKGPGTFTLGIKDALRIGLIDVFDEPGVWPTIIELYYKQRPTPELIESFKELIEWPRFYNYWKNIERKAKEMGLMNKNQSLENLPYERRKQLPYTINERIKREALEKAGLQKELV